VLPAREEEHPSGPKIHILGDDVRSRFIAHALSQSYAAVEMISWKGRSQSSKYNNIETSLLEQVPVRAADKQFIVEPLSVASRAAKEKTNERIENLIITGHGYEAVPALEQVKHRVNENTTICLMNDGLGVLEDVRERIFSGEVDSQPNFFLGHMNHRLVFRKSSNAVRQLKRGSMLLTPVARLHLQGAKTDKMYTKEMKKRWRLVERLHTVERLRASSSPLDEWIRFKLPSLMFQAAIEPVCVALDCSYQELLRDREGWSLMHTLLAEIFDVVAHLPEVGSSTSLQEFLRTSNPDAILISSITAKRDAPSLFMQQIAAGQFTDVDYNNGYFIRRAAKLGVSVPQNKMMRKIVVSKYRQYKRSFLKHVPLEETSLPHELAQNYHY
jgi:cytochrome b translational activator protein CBS2